MTPSIRSSLLPPATGTVALNAAQAEAVAHDEGPMLVIAGAGSGKTRVLTARIARLVRDRGVAADRILAVTFTNKAAGEMRERVAQLLSADPRGLWVGTFHAIGARLLRRYAARVARTPSFSIYDPDDTESLLKRLMEEANVSPKQHPVRAIAGAISDAMNALVTPADYRSTAKDPFAKAASAVYDRLEPALQRANAVTFDHLLTLPVQLLRVHPDVAGALSARFQYVLVDEYQDTNHAQYQLIRHLAAHGNAFVVGDDDQSIYGWRGADIRNILEFERDFPAAHVVRLEENYRSTPAVLSLANAIISENEARRGKTLRPTRAPGDEVTLVTAADDRDEADFVVDELLLARSRNRALSLGGVAVLYRTNAQSRPFEEALQKRGIPYRLVGQIRFYERREVKDMVAWLRLVANPADDEAFRRAIAAPRRGVGDSSVEMLAGAANVAGKSLLEVARNSEILPIRGAARSALTEFVAIIDSLRARAPELAVDELLRELLERTAYADWIGAEAEAEDRLANIEALVEGASQVRDDLEGEAGLAPLDLFLQRIALVTSADESDAAEGAVTLMTLHNAKGLEFPLVFISGLEDGLLPLMRGGFADDAALEEERRLFYVGITRAEDTLFITRAQRRWRNGETLPSTPSRFVRDLPADLIVSRRTVRARATPSFDTTWNQDDNWSIPMSGPRKRGTPVGGWVRETPRAAVDEDESQDAPAYSAGARVKHAKFGSGTIVDVSGHGGAAKARIDFDDQDIGRKTLMLAQANLERDWE